MNKPKRIKKTHKASKTQIDSMWVELYKKHVGDIGKEDVDKLHKNISLLTDHQKDLLWDDLNSTFEDQKSLYLQSMIAIDGEDFLRFVGEVTDTEVEDNEDEGEPRIFINKFNDNLFGLIKKRHRLCLEIIKICFLLQKRQRKLNRDSMSVTRLFTRLNIDKVPSQGVDIFTVYAHLIHLDTDELKDIRNKTYNGLSWTEKLEI
jgi:hypothetical protein